jgi:hypothetical protein
VRTPISSLGGFRHQSRSEVRQGTERLFFGFNAIFLWRYQVKQRFGSAIQFMEFTVTRLMVVLPTAFIEYSKEKGAVVQGAVFDGIVQFRHLDDTESPRVTTVACDGRETGTYT